MYYESTVTKNEKSGPVQEPIKKETSRNTLVYSHRTKLGCLLSEFPEAEGLSFPIDVSKDLVVTFLVMYRTHCQRILDTVIRANFDEVQHYLLHFWHGMPAHVQPILGSDRVARLIGICDSHLYKAVSTVLMPGLLQPLPESLGHVIRWFSKELQAWLKRALHGLPTCLQVAKLEEALHFALLLEKQMTLNHLAQAARTVTQSGEVILQMSDDWSLLDLDSICRQTVSVTCAKDTTRWFNTLLNTCEEFEKILDDGITLGRLTHWLDTLTKTFIVEPSNNQSHIVCKLTRKFLLTWSTFTSKVIRDLTIGSAPSFGSFHILQLMLEQYILYRLDLIMSDARMNATLSVLRGDGCQDDTLKGINEPFRLRNAACLTNNHTRKSPWVTSSNENPRYMQGTTDSPSFNAVPDWSRVQDGVASSHHSEHATWRQENTLFTHAQLPEQFLTTTF